MEQTREAVIDVAGVSVKVAVVHTLKSAKMMLERIKAGTADYQFIEVMAFASAAAVSLFRLMLLSDKNAVKRFLIATVQANYENRTKTRK